MSIEPGSWSDGSAVSNDLQHQEELARIRRLRQIATFRSASSSADSLAYADLLGKISSSTTGSETASATKVAIAMEQRLNLRVTEFVNKPVAYLAAGVDVAFPLSMGVRDLIMVDTDYVKFPLIDEIRERVAAIGKITHATRDELRFTANVGNGSQDMRIRISGEDARTFVPEEPLGGVIEMLGVRDGLLVRPGVANRLVRDAVIANFDFVPPELIPGRGSSFNFTDAGLMPMQGRHAMLHLVVNPSQLQRFAENPRYY